MEIPKNVDNIKKNARIGMVNFINTAPLYEVWQQTVVRPDWQVIEGPPTMLNGMLYNDELDLGFVSSHEYAAHPHEYKILSNLSISASGPVGSVFLFSHKKAEELSGELVLLSAQSQTSVSLVKIILEDFYGLQPRYTSPQPFRCYKGEKPVAVLAIGDDAIKINRGNSFPHAVDLGEAWRAETGLPFVFAVWAVRESFCQKDPDSVVAIHHELLRCVKQGRENLEQISQKVAGKIPMPPDDCFSYLQGIEYDLGPKKIEALELFFEYLIKREEGDKDALPLKICG